MNYEKEIKKLEAQIEELKAKVEADQEVPPVWVPSAGEAYCLADGEVYHVADGEVYYVANGYVISQYHWCHDEMDKYYLNVGNLFKTKQEAENYTRALILIETIRRERYKAQGYWWTSEDEARYTVCWNQLGSRAYINALSWELSSSVFGLWRDAVELRHIINKYDSELGWYFTEYLPSIN